MTRSADRRTEQATRVAARRYAVISACLIRRVCYEDERVERAAMMRAAARGISSC